MRLPDGALVLGLPLRERGLIRTIHGRSTSVA